MAKKELLFSLNKKDFEVKAMTAGGPGGQAQNKISSKIVIKHFESGAVGMSRDERSQHANKKIAFKRLINSSKFKLWLNQKAFEIINQKTLDQIVDELMEEKNLKFEVVNEEGKWEEGEIK